MYIQVVTNCDRNFTDLRLNCQDAQVSACSPSLCHYLNPSEDIRCNAYENYLQNLKSIIARLLSTALQDLYMVSHSRF